MPSFWPSNNGNSEEKTDDIGRVFIDIGRDKQDENVQKAIDQLINDVQSVEQSFATALRAMHHAEQTESKEDFVDELRSYIKRWEEHRLVICHRYL